MKTKQHWTSQIGPYRQYLKWDKQLTKALAGAECITAAKNIIEIYKPKTWYIENPRTSLLWKYLQLNLLFGMDPSLFWNSCVYSAYGYPSPKPTMFLSNVDLKLDNTRTKTAINFGTVDYKMRSSIPEKLLKEIFFKLNCK